MELFPGGELVGGGVGDFPLNAYHVSDDLQIGIPKASMRSLFGVFNEFEHQYKRKPKCQPQPGLFGYFNEFKHQFQLEHQPEPGIDLNSVPDESNNDNVLFQFQESPKTQQFNMVQNHVVPFEEGDVMMEELTPTPNVVDDLVFSSKEGDVVMEDLALPLNMVYNHVILSEKGDVIMEELAPAANMVPDHVVSSEARDVIMEDVTPAPVTLPDHVLSCQEKVYNEEAEEADDEDEDEEEEEEEEELRTICPLGVTGSCLPWTS
ncbi:uncharacterized protein [Euphorbia lathyris]|uniref:uncharacterized protein n=1 Tax=Euphorbia lathyris TaxID=212925 RepID=UPI003313B877